MRRDYTTKPKSKTERLFLALLKDKGLNKKSAAQIIGKGDTYFTKATGRETTMKMLVDWSEKVQDLGVPWFTCENCGERSLHSDIDEVIKGNEEPKCLICGENLTNQ